MKNNQRPQILKYSILFVLTAVFTFGYFVINGKSFVWHLDGYAQHSVALTYYGSWLRDIARNIIFQHTFTIPMWNFGIGYGGDIITTLNYYVLGDPLNLFSIFVPARYTEYLYAFLTILRLYLSGLFFIQFCNTLNRKGNRVIAGALMYVFTGYTMLAAVRHPFFVLPMMFFPLMLTGVEKILKERKPYQFIITIVLSAISNFYFFYMIAILTVIYTLVRCGFLYKNNLKQIFIKLGQMLFYAIIAIMISAVIFLPVIMMFLGDNRNAVNISVPLLYDLNYYQRLLSGLISIDSGGYWNYMGYSPIVIPALYFMFRKKKPQYYIFFLLFVLIMIIPFAGSFMNGLSYVSNRWIWSFALFCAFMLVEYWEEIISLDSTNFKQIVLLLAGYCILISMMKDTRIENVLLELLLLLFTVMVLYHLNTGQSPKKRKHEIILTAAIVIGISINSFYTYTVSEGNYVSQFIDMGQVYHTYQSSQSADIKKYAKDSDFFRFSSSGTEYSSNAKSVVSNILSEGISKDYNTGNSRLDYCDNAAILFGVNGIGYYWSLGNSNVSDYLLKTENKEYSTFFYHAIDDRAPLLSLSSVKYYISESGNEEVVPYGFEKYKTIKKQAPYELRNKKQRNTTKYILYQNNFVLPLGYTYDKFISESALDKLNGIEKEQIMLQAAVLEDTTNITTSPKPATSTYRQNYKITCQNGVTQKNNSFVVKRKGAGIFVEFKLEANTNLSVSIKNLQYTPTNPLLQFQEQINTLSLADKNILKDKYEYWKEGMKVSLYFNSSGVDKMLNHYAKNQSYYNGKSDYVINLGYSKNARNGFYIKFSDRGTYSFDDLEIIKQSFEHYEEWIHQRKEDVLTDVEIDDNVITGKIDLEQNKFLCLTIPYSAGWKVFVDGKENPLKKVNLMYSGVFLKPGRHEIRLEYCTPGLKTGAILSLAGIIAFLLLLIFQQKRSQISRNKSGA